MNKMNVSAFHNLMNKIKRLDFKNILITLGPYVLLLFSSPMVACRLCRSKKFVAIIKPPVIPNNDLEFDKYDILASDFKDYVINFIHTLTNNFSQEDLSYLYNNLFNLSINKQKIFSNHPIVLKSDALGAYFIKENEIKIYDKYYEDNGRVIYHELFHMASSLYNKDDKHFFSGFNQNINGIFSDIGEGINEGYTELLTQRYFRNGKKSKSYEIECGLAEKLEKIIGMEKMTKLYLRGNLYGLIEDLKNYASEESIMSFISNVDAICQIDDYEIIDIIFSMISKKEYLRNADLFLNQCMLQKQQINLSDVPIGDIQK